MPARSSIPVSRSKLRNALSDNFNIEGNFGYVDINYKEFMSGQSTTPGNPPINVASIVTPGYSSPFTANAALNMSPPLGMGEARLVGRVSYTYEDGKYSFSNDISTPFNTALKGDNRSIVDAQIGVIDPAGRCRGRTEAVVKNLTNSHDFVRGIDFGALGYAGGYYADPRTYGMSVGIRF